MRILLLITFTLFLSGCFEPPKNPIRKSNSALMCSDKNATNYTKTLPCICTGNYTVSSDKKSCIPQEIATQCFEQPENSIGGIQTSNDNGNSWGYCTDFICASGFVKVNGVCVESIQTRNCSIVPSNAFESNEVSTNGGQTFGSCIIKSCQTGYFVQNNQCVLSSQSRVCQSQPLNSNGGLEYTQNGGSTWSSCSNYQCNSNYSLINGQCVLSSQSRACQVRPSNSENGIETTINGGTTWSICSNFTCSLGYMKINNICVLSTQTRGCVSQPTNSNGGIETTINGGSTWSSCANYQCNVGYININGQCVMATQTRVCQTQPANSNSGTETTINGGSTWSSCQNYSCNLTYSKINGQCVTATTNEVAITDINKYLLNFQQNGSSRNKPVSIALSVTLDSTLSSSVLGLCVYASPRYILINSQWWNSSTTKNSDRQYLIFHEMAHCILNRPHKTETTYFEDDLQKSITVPVSMMYPSIISSNIYKNNMTYYHNELFDETISTQNVAIYYNNNTQYDPNYYTMALMAPISIISQKTSLINGEFVCADSKLSL